MSLELDEPRYLEEEGVPSLAPLSLKHTGTVAETVAEPVVAPLKHTGGAANLKCENQLKAEGYVKAIAENGGVSKHVVAHPADGGKGLILPPHGDHAARLLSTDQIPEFIRSLREGCGVNDKSKCATCIKKHSSAV
jgi:hypothetical protein